MNLALALAFMFAPVAWYVAAINGPAHMEEDPFLVIVEQERFRLSLEGIFFSRVPLTEWMSPMSEERYMQSDEWLGSK